VILYEMVTGKKAFDSNNVATLILQIMQKDPVPIRTLAPEVPVGLQRIIGKLLNKRPDQRFKNGEELAEALGRELAALTANTALTKYIDECLVKKKQLDAAFRAWLAPKTTRARGGRGLESN